MYLSPSAFLLHHKDPKAFYLKYFASLRLAREPATSAMFVGSVFDVIVKNALCKDLGVGDELPFPSDAPPESIEAGTHVMEEYIGSGAYGCLLTTLMDATDIEMESKGKRTLDSGAVIGGYPDLSYTSRKGIRVILDFKVNGYYSATAKSPNKGWLYLRSSKGHGPWAVSKYHNDVIPVLLADIEINGTYGLEVSNYDWAVQLGFYGLILGYDNFVTQVEQVVAKPTGDRPILRFATHSAVSSEQFKTALVSQINRLWFAIQEKWFFPDMTREDSDNLCRLLDKRAAGASIPNTFTISEVFYEQAD